MANNKNRFYADIMVTQQEVTGSCNLVIVKFPNGETTKFIVDCGLFQEKDYSKYNSTLPFNADDIRFALVTHNHVDHIGRLPLLSRNGFTGRIFATYPTCALMAPALFDSLKVLRDVSKRNNERCLYAGEDVENVLRRLKPCNYNQKVKIDENITATFFINGHLVGASIILVQISYEEYDDINLIFTGDYNNTNMFFDVPNLPDWVLDLPVSVIQESTYGDMDSTDMRSVFSKNIKRVIDNGGTAIVPVFSLGRSQEISYILKKMQETGILKDHIPIFLDGKLALVYTEMYLKKDLNIRDDMKNFLPGNITYVNKESRSSILTDRNPKIVLTTSGMGSYGPAQTYIPEYLAVPKSLIHFTGYTAEGTMGRRLQETEKGETVTVGGLVVKKQAEVCYTTEFSAHAKADEMIEFLRSFRNLKLVLVNHGETKTKQIFAKRILDKVTPKHVGILDREYFFRVNSYGLVKTMGTKFD